MPFAATSSTAFMPPIIANCWSTGTGRPLIVRVSQIERHGLQDSVGRVDEVTALDVARVAASHEDFPIA